MEKRLRGIFKKFMQRFGLGELKTRMKDDRSFYYRELDLEKFRRLTEQDHRGFIAISKGHETGTDLELWVMPDDARADAFTVMRIQENGTLHLGLDHLPSEIKLGLGPIMEIRRQLLIEYVRSI